MEKLKDFVKALQIRLKNSTGRALVAIPAPEPPCLLIQSVEAELGDQTKDQGSQTLEGTVRLTDILTFSTQEEYEHTYESAKEIVNSIHNEQVALSALIPGLKIGYLVFQGMNQQLETYEDQGGQSGEYSINDLTFLFKIFM